MANLSPPSRAKRRRPVEDRGNAVGDLQQGEIAGVPPVDLVHGFQPGEAEHQDGGVLLALVGLQDCGFNHLAEVGAVRDPGQRIVPGTFPRLALGCLAQREVLAQAPIAQMQQREQRNAAERGDDP
jgi:hypothetical protein